jgi:two-component system LytT family response regulator/two-component system response regulator LytT
MKIRCIIVDDEPPAVDELNYILTQIKDVEVVASAGSASEAVAAIKALQPDVVFLDIHMPRHGGFYIAKKISHYDKPPLIIFATAYDQYAVQAFDEGSLDYILKPFTEKRIQKAIIRAQKTLINRSQIIRINDLNKLVEIIEGTQNVFSRLPAEKKGHVFLIDPANILFCKAEEKKLLIYTQDDQFVCQPGYTLEELGKRLKFHSFFRTHRSYLVNLGHVKKIIPWFKGRYLLVMSDREATEVPVSRSNIKDLKTQLGL